MPSQQQLLRGCSTGPLWNADTRLLEPRRLPPTKTVSDASLCGTPTRPKPSLSPFIPRLRRRSDAAALEHLNTGSLVRSSHPPRTDLQAGICSKPLPRNPEVPSKLPKDETKCAEKRDLGEPRCKRPKTEVLPSFPNRGRKEAVGKLAPAGTPVNAPRGLWRANVRDLLFRGRGASLPKPRGSPRGATFIPRASQSRS